MIAVYGATGYTGGSSPTSCAGGASTATLCGRDEARLREVLDEVEADWPVRAAPVDDRGALRRALDGADAVINCAGPVHRSTASRSCAPRVDVGDALLRHDRRAAVHAARVPVARRRRRGAPRVARSSPRSASTTCRATCSCALAARGREPLRELVVAYSVKGFGATRGTLHSAMEILTRRRRGVRGRRLAPGGPRAAEPSASRSPTRSARSAVARYAAGEVVTAPRHIRTAAVRERITARVVRAATRLAPLSCPRSPGCSAPALRTPLRAASRRAHRPAARGPGGGRRGARARSRSWPRRTARTARRRAAVVRGQRRLRADRRHGRRVRAAHGRARPSTGPARWRPRRSSTPRTSCRSSASTRSATASRAARRRAAPRALERLPGLRRAAARLAGRRAGASRAAGPSASCAASAAAPRSPRRPRRRRPTTPARTRRATRGSRAPPPRCSRRSTGGAWRCCAAPASRRPRGSSTPARGAGASSPRRAPRASTPPGSSRRSAASRARGGAYGVELQRATIGEAVVGDGSLDAVTLWHVLEHLEDPGAALARVAGVAAARRGRLVGVPNLASVQARATRGRWFHLDAPAPPHALHAAGPRRPAARARAAPGAHAPRARRAQPVRAVAVRRCRRARRPTPTTCSSATRAADARDLAITAAALPLVPVAAAVELAAGLAGRGGTIA